MVTKSICVGQNLSDPNNPNSDCRLEIFYIGPDNGIYHNWQTTPGDGWYGGVHLGGTADRMCVDRNKDGSLELFYVGHGGPDNKMYHVWQNSVGWSDHTEFDGEVQDVCMSLNPSDGCLEVFYIYTDNTIFHESQKSPNTHSIFDWRPHNFGGTADQMCVGQNLDGRLELFYVGHGRPTNAMYHVWQNSVPTYPGVGWSGHTRFEYDEAIQICVARNMDGRLEIFYIGPDHEIYHNWQVKAGGEYSGSHWNGGVHLGGTADQMCVGQNLDGRLELFYVGHGRPNNALYHLWQNEKPTYPGVGWSDHTIFDGVKADEICVARNSNGKLQIFYTYNGAILSKWQTTPGTPEGVDWSDQVIL